MNASDLQQVRSLPLFSGLDDMQLGCIEPGEVIDFPAGTVLVSRRGEVAVFLRGARRGSSPFAHL